MMRHFLSFLLELSLPVPRLPLRMRDTTGRAALVLFAGTLQTNFSLLS
jgi:hypothetical protein